MKTIFKIFIVQFFFVQFISAQTCTNDSIVVRHYFENRNNFQGLLIQTQIEESVFNRDSGTVRISTQAAVMGAPFSPVSVIDTFWIHTDTLKNANGKIDMIFQKKGSSTGWKNYKTENNTYNAIGTILSNTKLNWNGNSWDSVSYHTWIYDVVNNLTEEASYSFNAGVRSNVSLIELAYANNFPFSKTFSIGVAGNQWEFSRRFIFTYTGNLRTSVEVDNYDTGSSSWQLVGLYSYGNNYGEYSFILPQYTPIVLNNISSADTLLTAYDTLEEKTFDRNVHFTSIDTSDHVFGVAGVVSYNIFNRFNGQLKIKQSWYSNWATFDMTDSLWYSVDRPAQSFYFYDLLGRIDTILSYGPCTNPCGDEQYFSYDNYNRPTFSSDYSWTMVFDHFQSNTYFYSDTSAITIAIAPNDTNFVGCRGDIFHPTISVIGGCLPYTYHWYPTAGLSSDTVLSPAIQINDAVTYHLVVQDNLGRIDSSTISVNSGYTHNLIIDTVYCNGITNLHLPIFNATYNWTLDSLSIPGANTNHYTATVSGDYHVSGTVDVGYLSTYQFTCAFESDTVTVQALALPVLFFSDDTLFTNFSGTQYNWFRDSLLINSGVDSFLIINQTGLYQATITASTGCVYQTDTLTVLNVGLTEVENAITIAPNPVHDRLLINGINEREITITNMEGEIFLQTHLKADRSLDVSFLRDGIYFLLIKSESRTIRKKFIKL